MMRATKILSLTPSALWIQPHYLGRALPWPPAGWTLARLLGAPRTLHGQAWGRALLALLVGILGLLTVPGALGDWSTPDLLQAVAGAARRPSLALGSGASPVLNFPGKSPTVM